MSSSQIFSKFRLSLASLYFVGFVLHTLDVANLRLNFSEMDSLWKSWILFLLVFDLFASIGLFLKKGWGEILFIVVAVCQLIAYTQFKSLFGQQDLLVYFHISTLTLYLILKSFDLWRQNETTSS